MEQLLDFTIATRDFDLHLLPEDSRVPGTQSFAEAVATHFGRQFAPMEGNVAVSVDEEEIKVVWTPGMDSLDPVAFALSLLQEGKLNEAIPLLQSLVAIRPDDAVLLYNLGVAESELGDLKNAIEHLERSVAVDAANINTLVALGIAQQRDDQTDAALQTMRRAVDLDPQNGYAQRSLGAILAGQGRIDEAIDHFREATRHLPGDQNSVFGLAQCLTERGDAASLSEADRLHRRVIDMDADSPFGELAREARRRYAERNFRTVPGLRMDAVMYCLAAFEKFADMSPKEVQNVAFEIALLGQQGLKVNEPDVKYNMRSLPGEFSGLNLVCLMYVGFQQIRAGTDVGFDLSREYAAAKQLYGRE